MNEANFKAEFPKPSGNGVNHWMTNGPLRLRSTKGRPTTDPRAKTSGAKRVSLEGNPVEIRATAVTAA